MSTSTVAAYFLGGTISMAGHDEHGERRLGGHELVSSAGAFPDSVDVQVHDFRQAPSGSLTFGDLHDLVTHLRASTADGIVVVQGTDTIEETSYLLDLLWDDDRPLVLTGAMRNPSLPGAEGAANLLAATAVAASAEFRGLGALVAMDDQVHAARFVRKLHSTSVGSFGSPDAGPLGLLVEGRPVRVLDLARRRTHPVTELTGRVPVLTATLGEEPAAVPAAATDADGLVVAGFGVGHVPASWAEPLGGLAARIPVVLASRTRGGPVLTETYAAPGSEKDLLARGLFSAGLLDPWKARILLLVCLAGGYDGVQVRAAFAEAGGLGQAAR